MAVFAGATLLIHARSTVAALLQNQPKSAVERPKADVFAAGIITASDRVFQALIRESGLL